MVMEYHESNGNRMTFELSNVEINPMIDDGYFEIDVDGYRSKAQVGRQVLSAWEQSAGCLPLKSSRTVEAPTS